MRRVWYPRVEELINLNKNVLETYRVKKKDHFNKWEVNRGKIQKAIQSARARRGDVEDKAVTLMRRINQLHPFGSGNRRTAHLALNRMLYCNKNYMVAMKVNKFDKIQKKIRDRTIKDRDIRKEYRL